MSHLIRVQLIQEQVVKFSKVHCRQRNWLCVKLRNELEAR